MFSLLHHSLLNAPVEMFVCSYGGFWLKNPSIAHTVLVKFNLHLKLAHLIYERKVVNN